MEVLILITIPNFLKAMFIISITLLLKLT